MEGATSYGAPLRASPSQPVRRWLSRKGGLYVPGQLEANDDEDIAEGAPRRSPQATDRSPIFSYVVIRFQALAMASKIDGAFFISTAVTFLGGQDADLILKRGAGVAIVRHCCGRCSKVRYCAGLPS